MSFNYFNINNNKIGWGMPLLISTPIKNQNVKLKSVTNDLHLISSQQTMGFSINYNNKSDINCDINKKESSNKFNSNNSLLPVKLEFHNNLNFQSKSELDNLSDEYSGLSYLNMPNCETAPANKGVKKYSDYDYRTKYKTEKCKYWEINMICKYGDNCAFAHGLQDIRDKSCKISNYKTKKCKQFFESGYCCYGSRCQFLHKDSSNPVSFKLKKFSYKRSIDELNSLNDNKEDPIRTTLIKLDNISDSIRPRLGTFEKIVHVEEEENKKSKLCEDVLQFKNNFLKDQTHMKKESSNELDFNEDDDKPSPRSRFFSA